MSLIILLAPMKGSKTTELLRLLVSETFANQRALYINHSLDTRSADPFSTHNPLLKKSLRSGSVGSYPISEVDSHSIRFISDLDDAIYNKYDVIGVDEAQFFDDIEHIIHLVDVLKKRVYIAALNGDYKRNVFGKVYKLFSHADDIRFLRDVWCVECANEANPAKAMTKAIFSHRANDATGNQIEVGADNYEPLCRQCYISKNSKAKK